ncbi:MAG: endonuclease/exonuclease/phosphatase family protein, partial [Pseudomonadota bacterium]
RTGNILSAGLQPETTELVGGAQELTIATYNVLNLDPVVENPANLLPDVNNGVDDDIGDGRFEAIAEQIVNNLNAPDIIGLQEIQDNTGAEGVDSVTDASVTLQTLVDAIVEAGGPTYEFIDNPFIADDLGGGIPGGNIQTAYLYNPDRVGLSTPLTNPFDGQGGITGNGQQAGQAFNGARLPLVATFTFNGEDVHIVNNHFSSKGGSAPLLGVEQPFDARQEDVTVNGSLDERQAQSQAVQDVVDGILGSDPNANVVVLGDFNEFEFISAVSDFETDSGLTNLTNALPEDERYSFLFQGNSQSLDHIIVSESLASSAEVDIVHVNTEFARQDSTASDHDPIVARFSLGDAPVEPPSDDFEELPLFAFADDEGGRFEVGGGSIGGLLFNFVGPDQLRITNESVNDSTPTFTTVKNYDVNNDQIILEEGVEISSVLPGFGGTTIIKFNGKGLFGLGDTLTVVSNNGFTADVLDTIVREGESDSIYEAPTPSRSVDLETGIINTFGFQSFIDFWF